MFENRELVYFLLMFNIAAGIIYYIRVKCEIPLFLAVFNLIVEYRIISLKLGYGSWVSFDYGIQLRFNFELAYIVSNLILMGTTILMYCFMLFYKPIKKKINDSDAYLKQFIDSKKKYVILGLIFFSLLQLVVNRGSGAGGYSFLIRLGNVSFIILLFILFTFTDKSKLITKLIYIGVFLYLAYTSFSPELRFQILGWSIPIGYYSVRNIKPSFKLLAMAAGLVVIVLVFSLVRALQYKNDVKSLNNSELLDVGIQRVLVADDVNFIDGFIMMYQIYPKYLDYDYGLEHLDIIFRPIPRALWPGKPLAAWFQHFAAKYGTKMKMVGFSPTLYGVFYAEGGEVGIVILSIIWAFILSWLYRSFSGFNSSLSFIIIGVLLASLVPILRSGDLPGDFAIVLMSYWPMIIFVRQYKKFVRRQVKIDQYKKLALL